MTPNKMPTMTDVARAAGVSQSTVSIVLNEKPGQSIPEATKAKVIKACEELGYQMNFIARAMNRGESGIIGLVADDLFTTNFAGDIITGAQDAAWKRNKLLILSSIQHGNAEIIKQSVEYLQGFRVESVLYAAQYLHTVKIPTELEKTTNLLINCYDNQKKFSCIVPDDYQGAYNLTEYLINNGHRNIFYIDSIKYDAEKNLDYPAAQLRSDGFFAAMKDHNINASQENNIAYVKIAWENVIKLVLDLLQKPNRPSAIMCFNDRTAVSVYSAAAKLNLKIPDDLSVVGYDNQTEITQFLYPTLTTVELPHYKMGVEAIEFVERQKTKQKHEEILVKPEIILGNSVKKI